MDCRFCELINEKNLSICELPGIELFYFHWDSFPATPGHSQLLPKRHAANFRDLSVEEQTELPKAILAGYEFIESSDLISVYEEIAAGAHGRSGEALVGDALAFLKSRDAQAPDAYNHGLNDGEAAGRTIHHFHYHLMPRWTGDVEDPRGGIRHMFAGKGNWKQHLQ